MLVEVILAVKKQLKQLQRKHRKHSEASTGGIVILDWIQLARYICYKYCTLSLCTVEKGQENVT